MDNWPFSEPENLATLTVRQIVLNEMPILRVSHDADDGMWQFLTGEQVDMADAMLVSLRKIATIDSSISELADLPLGWMAERSAPGEPWLRQKVV